MYAQTSPWSWCYRMGYGMGWFLGQVIVQNCPALKLKIAVKSEALLPVHTKGEFASVSPESTLVQVQSGPGSSCLKDKPKVLLYICCSWSFTPHDLSQDLILHIKSWPWFIGLTYASGAPANHVSWDLLRIWPQEGDLFRHANSCSCFCAERLCVDV